MHWGHAVSPDLVHWETLPIALYPDSIGTIFSGSAVIDVNNTAGFGANAMVAVFSYNTQAQGVAYSTDRGRTWTMYANNPVIDAQAKDFRDPKVFWHDESGQWVMIISAGHEAELFTSPNLLEWRYASRFSAGHIAGTWEVPDLFPLEIDGQTKWVMLVSVNRLAPAGGTGIQYFVGGFDGHTFVNDNPSSTILWLDYGADNYAGTTFNDQPDGKRIYIGWMNNWDYAESIPTSPWRGAMTLPRELNLVHTPDGIRLTQIPIAAFEQLRQPIGKWDDLDVSDALLLTDVRGRTLEIIADIDAGTAQRFGLEVHLGEGDKTRIVYNVEQSQFFTSRSASAAGAGMGTFNPAFGAPLILEEGRLHLRIYVDESSVEIFTGDGSLAMTSQIFGNPTNESVGLFADGGSIKVNHLEIYALTSIWSNIERGTS